MKISRHSRIYKWALVYCLLMSFACVIFSIAGLRDYVISREPGSIKQSIFYGLAAMGYYLVTHYYSGTKDEKKKPEENALSWAKNTK